jgi:hypothetical protein
VVFNYLPAAPGKKLASIGAGGDQDRTKSYESWSPERDFYFESGFHLMAI